MAEHEPISKWTEKLAGDIGEIMALGAPPHEAEAYVLLTSKRFAMAKRLRSRDPRYAASTYALPLSIYKYIYIYIYIYIYLSIYLSMLLTSKRFAMAKRLRSCDPRYAAST